MKTVSETLATPISYSTDVLVAGGGIAGIAAALAAARSGVNVTLLERGFMLGGLATAGLVTIYLPLCDGMGTQVSFGLAEELLLLFFLWNYAQRIPPGLGSLIMERCRKRTAFSRPSLAVMRLSSCSIESTPS